MMRAWRGPFPGAVLSSAAFVLVMAGQLHGQAPCPDTPGDAHAFLAVDRRPASLCPQAPVVRWFDPEVTFECGFFEDPEMSIPCGGTPQQCVERCRDAAAVWNRELVGRFTFVEADETTVVESCNPEDGRTSVGGSQTMCDGSAFSSNVLAVTLRVNFVGGPRNGELVDADITVNQAFPFSQARFQSTLGHEFGHVLGLDHPDRCGMDFNVLMRYAARFTPTDPCFVLDPTVDDVSGAVEIYPSVVVPTPSPSSTPMPACGDPDGRGGISVSDGVQVLRAAAGLTSNCAPETCDVNGNGRIDVGDGVAVLRGAAGLGFEGKCPGSL
jgi:hypothetical protein